MELVLVPVDSSEETQQLHAGHMLPPELTVWDTSHQLICLLPPWIANSYVAGNMSSCSRFLVPNIDPAQDCNRGLELDRKPPRMRQSPPSPDSSREALPTKA